MMTESLQSLLDWCNTTADSLAWLSVVRGTSAGQQCVTSHGVTHAGVHTESLPCDKSLEAGLSVLNYGNGKYSENIFHKVF